MSANGSTKRQLFRRPLSNGAKNIESLKSERKAAGKHIAVKDLPEEDRFRQLRSEKEHFVDTIKLIAYRVHDEVVARAILKRNFRKRACTIAKGLR